MELKKIIFLSMLLCVAIPKKYSASAQDIILKHLQRDSRAGSDDFENFFLKASKSVPRIGRRDFDLNTKYFKDSSGVYRPYIGPTKMTKKFDTAPKELHWSDLAERIEYYPEILMSPSLLANEEFIKGTDTYDDDQNKRTEPSRIPPVQNKEILEYRFHP